MCHSKFLTLVLSLLLLSQSIPTSVSAANGDLGALCVELRQRSVNLKECNDFFIQDRRSSTAKFTVLVAIAVDVVTNNAAKVQSLVDTLLKKERDSTLKGILDVCSGDYYNIMLTLNKAKADVLAKNYGPVRSALSSYSYGAATQCINEKRYKGAVIPSVRDESTSLLRKLDIAEFTVEIIQKKGL